MSDLQVSVNAEERLLSYEEAAEKLGISYEGMRSLLKRHKDIKARYVRKSAISGRRKFVITEQGLNVLMMAKDSIASNKHTKNNATLQIQPKQELAEAMIEKQALVNSDPMMAQLQMLMNLRQGQLAMETRLSEVEKQVASPLQIQETVKQFIEEPTENEPLTHSQRVYLKERVNALAFRLSPDYPDFARLRSSMNDFVGKRSVDLYKMSDYSVALKWLKKEYVRLNLPW